MVYPNPVHTGGVISWSGLPPQVARIEIYDAGARLIQASSAMDLRSISTAGWESGIYTVRWIGMGYVKSAQVVIK